MKGCWGAGKLKVSERQMKETSEKLIARNLYEPRPKLFVSWSHIF